MELLIIIIGGVVAFFLCYFWPSFLLSLLILFTLVQEEFFVSLEEVASLNQAFGLMLLSVAVFRALMVRQLKRLYHPVSFAMLFLFVYMVFSFFTFSIGYQDPLQDINQFIRAFAYYLICLLVIRKERDVVYLVGAYISGGIIVAISGSFWNAVVNPINYNLITGRGGIHGITGHYIEYAIRCIVAIPLTYYAATALEGSRWLKRLLIAIGLSLSISVLLSGSRGAIVSYAFMTTVFILTTKISARGKVVFGIILLSIPLALPINELLNNLFSIARADFPTDYSFVNRAYYIKDIIENISYGSIIWGRGLENFRNFYSPIHNPPHSVWMQSFFELGLIGLVPQIFMVIYMVKLFLWLSQQENGAQHQTTVKLCLGISLSVFVILFWGLFENVGWLNGSKHLFILMGALIAGSRIVGIQGVLARR